MLALECAYRLTSNVSLLEEGLGEVELQALAETLQQTRDDVAPGLPTEAVAASIEDQLTRVKRLGQDVVLGLWSVARQDATSIRDDDRRAWLVQMARRLLPRPALRALLGIDRAELLALIASHAVLDEAARQRSIGLADNHLHSGAADELGELVSRLVPRVVDGGEPRALAEAVGVDTRGKALNAGPLLLALAAACLQLDAADTPAGHDEEVLAAPEWWLAIRRSAEDAGSIDEARFTALRKTVQTVARQRGLVPQLLTLYDALDDIAQGGAVSPHKQLAARRGLVALSTLHTLVAVPRHGSTLGTFVQRFNLMRAVRGLFGDDDDRLRSALRTMYRFDGVTAVELRKSILARSGRTISVPRLVSSIQTDIQEHAAAALDTCTALERDDLVVRMPLTFTRRDAEPVDLAAESADFLAFRAPVAETLAVADAIAQVTRNDAMSRFVGAIDVVGNEKKVPNWLYALAFQRIEAAHASTLEFACHAGEYFEYRMEGLRRIAETALFGAATPRRIGHCLALRAMGGGQSDGGRDGVTLLENLAWAMLMLEGSIALNLGIERPCTRTPRETTEELKRTVLCVGCEVFGDADLSIGDIRSWYLDRFRPAVMGRWIGQLAATRPEETSDWLRGARRATLPEPASMLDAMLGATVYEASFDVRQGSRTRRASYRPSVACQAERRIAEELFSALAEPLGEDVARWLACEGKVIESCPSSNAALGGLPIERHPIWDFHGANLVCSVNTDDPALFGASLHEEYAHAGMVAERVDGAGREFVAKLAHASRTDGMVQRPLCGDGERPADVYRQLAGIAAGDAVPELRP